MYCEQCGSKIGPQAKFCSGCGQIVSTASDLQNKSSIPENNEKLSKAPDWYRNAISSDEKTKAKFKKALEDELNQYPEVDREQVIKESERDYVDLQWDYFKKLSIRIGIGILVLIVGLVIYFLNPGLGKNSENSNQSLTQQEVNDEPQEVSANYVCQNIGDIVISYQNFITKWRNVNNNMTLSDLNEYSDQASNDLIGIAEDISAKGITWDSGAVVAALIINAADYIEELAAYTNRGFFAPGRYVNVILSDIDISAGAVLGSACK
jgi:hypothetical protein